MAEIYRLKVAEREVSLNDDSIKDDARSQSAGPPQQQHRTQCGKNVPAIAAGHKF
jgi:hypothetical protein